MNTGDAYATVDTLHYYDARTWVTCHVWAEADDGDDDGEEANLLIQDGEEA